MILVLGLVRWTAQTLARSASEISAAKRQISRSTLLLGRDSWIFRGNSAVVLRTRKIDKNDSGYRVIFEEYGYEYDLVRISFVVDFFVGTKVKYKNL
jgi:hypothetical protein